MTEQFPISIQVCDDLANQWASIRPITTKLAAQFNFQAMAANWYGEEDKIISIQLLLETPQRFAIQQDQQKGNKQTSQAQMFTSHSDDVFSVVDEKQSQQFNYTIAITEHEQDLLAQHSNLLSALLKMKLQKILNIIAKQLSLSPI